MICIACSVAFEHTGEDVTWHTGWFGSIAHRIKTCAGNWWPVVSRASFLRCCLSLSCN